MIKIRELDHVVLRARDPDNMISFYRDVLGCEVEKTQAQFGLYQLRAGSSLIDLVDVNGKLGRLGGAAPGDEGRNMDHFCLRVEPFNETEILKHLASFGISAAPAEPRYGAEGTGPSIYIVDPEDNVVELKGPPAIG